MKYLTQNSGYQQAKNQTSKCHILETCINKELDKSYFSSNIKYEKYNSYERNTKCVAIEPKKKRKYMELTDEELVLVQVSEGSPELKTEANYGLWAI